METFYNVHNLVIRPGIRIAFANCVRTSDPEFKRLLRALTDITSSSLYFDDPCAICLETYEKDHDIVCRLRPCKHLFHKTCLENWLNERQTTCPLCRCRIYNVCTL